MPRPSPVAAAALAATALVAAAVPAAAQIVNVQPKLQVGEAEGVSGALGASVEWKTGNTRMLTLGGEATTRLVRKANHLIFLMSGRYVSAEGAAFERRVMEHLRYRRDLMSWLGVEAFGQHEFNQFRRLRLRGLVGGGPRLSHAFGSFLELALGTAYMLEHERLDWVLGEEGELLADSGRRTTQHRWSSYLSVNLAVSDRFQLVHTVYAQPRFDDPADLRLLAEATARVALVESFALAVSGSLAWDRRPPLAVEPLDTLLVTSLEWAFGPLW